MRDSAPLIPVRVTECILGRVASSHFLVVFPAHFLGCIVGVVFFQFLCPASWSVVSRFMDYTRDATDSALCAESNAETEPCLTFVSCCWCAGHAGHGTGALFTHGVLTSQFES